MGLVAKKAGFADGDFVEELYHLAAVSTSVCELFQVFAHGSHLQFLHAAAATVGEETELSIGLEVAGRLRDEIANPVQVYIWV